MARNTHRTARNRTAPIPTKSGKTHSSKAAREIGTYDFDELAARSEHQHPRGHTGLRRFPRTADKSWLITHACAVLLTALPLFVPATALAQQASDNVLPTTTAPNVVRNDDGYTGMYMFLTGGPMFATGRGAAALQTRASGTLFEFERGSLSDTMGTGFTFEMRALDWAWLPNRPETRVRFGMATLGARFHAITLFRRYTERLPGLGRQVGPGVYELTEPRDVEQSVEYLGVGAFARADVLSWTYVDNGKTDPRFPYDPYVEGGLYFSPSTSVEWLGGLEVSAGAAASTSSGGMLFMRIEALLFGYRGRGAGPFSKVYGKKI